METPQVITNGDLVGSGALPEFAILITEDDEGLARLIQKKLSQAGYQAECVRKGGDAIAWLTNDPDTLLILDYRLPDMTGQEVIEALSEQGIEIPFITTTGYGDEKIAVQMMKLGARDYLVKDTHLLDLLPAVVERVIDQLQMEYRLAQAERALQESADRFRLLYENAPLGYQSLDKNGLLIVINKAWLDEFGYERDEIIGQWFGNYISPNYRDKFSEYFQLLIKGEEHHGLEFEMVRKNGTTFIASFDTKIARDQLGNFRQTHCIFHNITRRKLAEEETQRQLERLATLRTIDEAITTNFDLEVTLNVLLEQLVAQLEVDAADIAIFEGPTQILVYVSGRGFKLNTPSQTMLRIGQGLPGQVALERRMIHLPDLTTNQHSQPDTFNLIADEGFISYFGIPLIVKHQVKGVLELFHRSKLEPVKEWFNFLDTLSGQAAIAIDNASLFNDLQRSNLELALAYDRTLEGWAKTLEIRDHETEGHSKRVTDLTLALARRLGISRADLVHVRRGALLHDIGKLGIPDNILQKPGPLDAAEWEIMYKHPTYAYELLSPIHFLRPALDIPYCHHEKWDGSGYPRGLQGEQIPLAARIFAVVDVWDALLSDRPYREAWPDEKALAYIKEQFGQHFDPKIAAIFFETITAKT